MVGIHLQYMPLQWNLLVLPYSSHSALKCTAAFQLGTSTHTTQDLGAAPPQANVQEGASSHQKEQGEIFLKLAQ